MLRGNRQSPYEKKLSSMADIFEEQASGPATDTQVFQEGKRELDESDDRRREQVQNSSAASGATDEARLASMEDSNEVYADAYNRLMSRAKQYQDQMRQRYMQTIGQQEQARRASDAQFQKKVNSITRPLGQASRAFLMSDIFSNPTAGASGQQIIADTPQASAEGGPTDASIFDFNASGYA